VRAFVGCGAEKAELFASLRRGASGAPHLAYPRLFIDRRFAP